MDDFGPTRLIDDKSLRVLRAKSRTLDGTLPVAPARAVLSPAEPTPAQRRWSTLGGALAGIVFGTIIALLLQPAGSPARAEARVVMSKPAPLFAPPAALLQAAASREVATAAQVVAASEVLVRARATVLPAASPTASSPRRVIRRPAVRRVAPKL